MGERVVVPGARDVRGTLDSPVADACVVACPPHPRQGGRRTDRRLRAVSDALGEREIACLRFDYGPCDEGKGERRDAAAAAAWARERYDAVALFGYSFGATVALAAAPDLAVFAVSALAPAPDIADLDALAALDRIDAPVQVLRGARDTRVDCTAVAERARERGHEVVEIDADHAFAGRGGEIGERVAAFVERHRP